MKIKKTLVKLKKKPLFEKWDYWLEGGGADAWNSAGGAEGRGAVGGISTAVAGTKVGAVWNKWPPLWAVGKQGSQTKTGSPYPKFAITNCFEQHFPQKTFPQCRLFWAKKKWS